MKVSVSGLEAYLEHLYGEWSNEQSLFMKMVEEMGEVAEILNKRAGRKAVDGDDLDAELGKELADVIHYALGIAAVTGLDMEKIIVEKDKKAAIKYHHEINLEDFLAERGEN